MPKILLAGASVYGLNNISDDVMLKVLCMNLQKKNNEINITILLRHPNKEIEKYYNVKAIRNMDFDSKEQSLKYDWFKGLNPFDDTRHLNDIYKEIKNCDILIIGGDPFIDITIGLYRGLTPYVTILVTLAKFLQKPIIFNGIHICRPINSQFAKELMRYCLSNSNAVTCRERFSIDRFNEYEVNIKNIEVCADAAWALDPYSISLAKKVLLNNGIEPANKKFVGLTFRSMYWKWNKEERDKYFTIFAAISDYIIEKYQMEIIFIPHCTYNIDNFYEDDRTSHAEVFSLMKYKEKAHQIKNQDMDSVISIFNLLEFAIGNRRHTLIFSAVHNVPAISFGEEWHVKPVMEEFEFLKNMFIEYKELNFIELKNRCDYLYNNRINIKEKIKNILPILRESALKNVDIVLKYLNNH